MCLLWEPLKSVLHPLDTTCTLEAKPFALVTGRLRAIVTIDDGMFWLLRVSNLEDEKPYLAVSWDPMALFIWSSISNSENFARGPINSVYVKLCRWNKCLYLSVLLCIYVCKDWLIKFVYILKYYLILNGSLSLSIFLSIKY